ncbi:MAG: DNA repair protein RadA [Dissulfurimicrobium sp.]|uniref:DNA repair protein RadA n=1 Tax=Dissulfurimicrobium sp. TaxID=2022436 RepID=UPI003D114A22
MSKEKMKRIYICQSCNYRSFKWLGRCPDCGVWNSFTEEIETCASAISLNAGGCPERMSEIATRAEGCRIITGIKELDRVLGGGLVPGSVVLLGGEPGIGKSTLLLQFLGHISGLGNKVLYISGEESPEQIRMRAERLGIEMGGKEDFWLAGEVMLERIERYVSELSPMFLAVDSIQTVICEDLESAAGSISQIRESAARLIRMSKPRGLSVFLIGHVTKEGVIAGPRVLEHLVDTVLYFEGERGHAFRILRTVKNRYGPTHEIGVFEMTGEGLREIVNPSEIFLTSRSEAVAGSVVTVCLEGTRPMLVEIQALVSRSYLANPRRTSTGFDANRLAMLVAVGERHLGTVLYDKDIFINVAGGLRIIEPAADLAVLMAIVSSLKGIPIPGGTALFGEVGLTGEVRAVTMSGARLNEAARLGLKCCLIPWMGGKQSDTPKGLDVEFVRDVKVCAERLGL